MNTNNKSLIADVQVLILVIFLVIIGNFFYDVILDSVKWIFKTETLTIKHYFAISMILLIVFIFIQRYVLNRPVTDFY